MLNLTILTVIHTNYSFIPGVRQKNITTPVTSEIINLIQYAVKFRNKYIFKSYVLFFVP